MDALRRTTPVGDDVATGGPTVRPRLVLLELPLVVFDVSPLAGYGISISYVSLVGRRILETLALRADAGDQDLLRAVEAAIETGISQSNLDYYEPSDPDGRFDNRPLANRYRVTAPAVIPLAAQLPVHADAADSLAALYRSGFRTAALPFLGPERSRQLIANLAIGPAPLVNAESPEDMIVQSASALRAANSDTAVICGSESIAQAAMRAGFGTVWVDRAQRVRGSSGTMHLGKWITTKRQWTPSGPVPVIADDLAHATDIILRLSSL